jgi:catechol 2,3-dioxygenase-like lactoylglutathione lyase family enzyme
MTIKESNVTINVKELAKSIAFYESIGLTVKTRWGDHYAQLTAPGIVIGLHPTTADNLPGNSGNISIGFTVDDFEEAQSFMDQRALHATQRQEEGGQFLHFKDPDGTSLYFIKPKW